MNDEKNMTDNFFKILIVDDEPEARLLLKSLLRDVDNIKIVGEASSAEEALFLLVEHFPNLILLDINMPGISGLGFVQTLRKANIDIPVVFVSAFKRYAQEAIRCGVYDFLLKPVEFAELNKLIAKYKRLDIKDLSVKLSEVLSAIKEESKIRINSRHSYILVNPEEIIYCEADGGYTNIFLANGKVEVSNSTLSQIEKLLEVHNFFRLGRSVLVNKQNIRSINKTKRSCILEKDDSKWEINASQKSIKEFLEKGMNYA